MSDWRTWTPTEDDIPSSTAMLEAGFPDRLTWACADNVRAEPEWQEFLRWWDALDAHLQVPRGLAVWERGLVAANVLTVAAKRFMCWRGLPVPRGVRVGGVGYVEMADMGSADVYDKARQPGTLLVGGVGYLEFGEDKAVELAVGLGQMRHRAGCLTLWHLCPLSTPRSQRVCEAVVRGMSASILEIGGKS